MKSCELFCDIQHLVLSVPAHLMFALCSLLTRGTTFTYQNVLVFILREVRFYVLKGMGESFRLSKDEPLTPDIDGVIAL